MVEDSSSLGNNSQFGLPWSGTELRISEAPDEAYRMSGQFSTFPKANINARTAPPIGSRCSPERSDLASMRLPFRPWS